jgi:hypothetical protein
VAGFSQYTATQLGVCVALIKTHPALTEGDNKTTAYVRASIINTGLKATKFFNRFAYRLHKASTGTNKDRPHSTRE